MEIFASLESKQFPFWAIPFLDGSWCVELQTESHKYCYHVQNGRKNTNYPVHFTESSSSSSGLTKETVSNCTSTPINERISVLIKCFKILTVQVINMLQFVAIYISSIYWIDRTVRWVYRIYHTVIAVWIAKTKWVDSYA